MFRTLAVAGMVALVGAAAAGDSLEDRKRQQALDHYRAGQEAMYRETWDEAEKEFRAAVGLDPLLSIAHFGLGQTLMATKRYPEAIKAFTEAIDSFRRVAALHAGNVLEAERRREDELRELRQDLQRLRSGQIRVFQPQSMEVRLESRITELENLKRAGSDAMATPAEFSLSLGSAYFRTGALAEAQRNYEAAVKTNPKLGEAHNNLAVVYMLTGRLEEAEQAVKRAEKAGFPVNPQLKKDIESRKKG